MHDRNDVAHIINLKALHKEVSQVKDAIGFLPKLRKFYSKEYTMMFGYGWLKNVVSSFFK